MIYTHLVVIARVDVASHSEVRDLDDESGVDETVPSRQVSMDEVTRGEVFHSVRNLRRYGDQVGLRRESRTDFNWQTITIDLNYSQYGLNFRAFMGLYCEAHQTGK